MNSPGDADSSQPKASDETAASTPSFSDEWGTPSSPSRNYSNEWGAPAVEPTDSSADETATEQTVMLTPISTSSEEAIDPEDTGTAATPGGFPAPEPSTGKSKTVAIAAAVLAIALAAAGIWWFSTNRADDSNGITATSSDSGDSEESDSDDAVETVTTTVTTRTRASGTASSTGAPDTDPLTGSKIQIEPGTGARYMTYVDELGATQTGYFAPPHLDLDPTTWVVPELARVKPGEPLRGGIGEGIVGRVTAPTTTRFQSPEAPNIGNPAEDSPMGVAKYALERMMQTCIKEGVSLYSNMLEKSSYSMTDSLIDSFSEKHRSHTHTPRWNKLAVGKKADCKYRVHGDITTVSTTQEQSGSGMNYIFRITQTLVDYTRGNPEYRTELAPFDVYVSTVFTDDKWLLDSFSFVNNTAPTIW